MEQPLRWFRFPFPSQSIKAGGISKSGSEIWTIN
jgi:hypothetical protein